ncbi:Uncharacterized protein GBIM_06232 [Gryllus bimaculatus]|nr:Uncharacterized protein GBIM_06232 [Gryllus bimaculatus]
MQAAIIINHGQMQRSPLPEKKAIDKSPAVTRKYVLGPLSRAHRRASLRPRAAHARDMSSASDADRSSDAAAAVAAQPGGSNMNGVKAEGLHANRIRPIKITAVGDGMVGKTFDNYADNIIVDEQEFNMTLWDTAGQEDYERLRPLSYPNTDCFLLCYSVASRSSYENIVSKWYPEIRHHCPTVPIVLVATKIDLREEDEQEIISENEGKVLKRRIKAAKYMECSAKNMQGLREVFVEAIRTVMKKPPPPRRICAILTVKDMDLYFVNVFHLAMLPSTYGAMIFSYCNVCAIIDYHHFRITSEEGACEFIMFILQLLQNDVLLTLKEAPKHFSLYMYS